MKILKDKDGTSAAGVIIILAILTAVGVVFVSLFTTSIDESVTEVNSTRALYAAEAGIESAIGHLKKNPVSANWSWNDGYKGKAVGQGSIDVEALQYEIRDGSAPAPCENFVSSIKTSGAPGTNVARTVVAVLAWDSSNNSNILDLNLYSDGACTTQIAAVTKTVLSNSVLIRYRIPDAAPKNLFYSVAVLNNAGGKPYKLGISHPDDTETVLTPAQFTASSMRSIISKGSYGNSFREIFTSFRRP